MAQEIKKLNVVKPARGGTVKVTAPVKKTAAVAPVVTAKTLKSVGHSVKNIKISPRKLRSMVDVIRKITPSIALTKLKFTNNKSSRVLVKALDNVISNAKNLGIIVDTLRFETLKVDEGLKIKKMDKAHGSRFARGLIQRRHSRLEIVVKGETN